MSLVNAKYVAFGFFIILFFEGCLKKDVFHDPSFYYDEETLTLYRINPETGKGYKVDDFILGKDKKNDKISTSLSDSLEDNKKFDKPPRPKKIVTPVYPKESKKKGYQGTILLKLLINREGFVLLAQPENVERLKGQNRGVMLLVESALKAAIKTEFYPAIAEGKPLPVWVSFPVEFILKNNVKEN
jgi:hypothetical protein